eukprot:183213-Amphidinium_carterae.4
MLPAHRHGCVQQESLLWVQALDDEVDSSCIPMPTALQGKAPPGLVVALIGSAKFDGDRWHCVLPSSGRRLSISLINARAYHVLRPYHWLLDLAALAQALV